MVCSIIVFVFFFFQAEDGIRDLVRSRGLGDVYKRQREDFVVEPQKKVFKMEVGKTIRLKGAFIVTCDNACLLYTSDAADERSSVDLGGRRIIKKKNN